MDLTNSLFVSFIRGCISGSAGVPLVGVQTVTSCAKDFSEVESYVFSEHASRNMQLAMRQLQPIPSKISGCAAR